MIYLSQIIDGKQTLQKVSMPEFSLTADVIVCGLGTAGSLAAAFCAENGLTVIGIEQFSCVGGTHTAGGVQGHYFGFPGGRYLPIDETVREFAARYTCTNAEARKLTLEQMLLQQGVRLCYNTTVCGVYLQDNTVIGIQALSDAGITDMKCRILMDCTADAYAAVTAGCETVQGRAIDGQMQPYSIVSMYQNGEKYGYTNVDYGRVDPCDPEAFSKAIVFARSYNITEGHTGKTAIAQMPLIGLREGRRIIPEETVTLPKLFAGKKTETPMFYAYADLDKHGWDIAFDGEDLGDWAIGANLGAYNVTVAVPYRCILPKGFENILVPCRALGVDRDIASCVRMIPDMKKLAECAAQWATLAVHKDCPLRDVPYPLLKEKLEASGCLQKIYPSDYRIDGKKDWDGSPLTPRDVQWCKDPGMLADILATDKPGQAIWSVRYMGDSAVAPLEALLESSNENLRKHAAFALSMLGNHTGSDILRDMVATRDDFLLKDSRKNNNLRGCVAIYWLGRLGDRQAAPELLSLICDPEEIHRSIYCRDDLKTTRYDISDFQGVYFQFVTQAVMALIRIGDAHKDLQPEIAAGFCAAFTGDGYYHRITGRPKESSEGSMVLGIRQIALAAADRWHTNG